MATKNATASATNGHVLWDSTNPYTARSNTVDFSAYGIGASGADVVELFPLNPGETVHMCHLRITTGSTNTGATVSLADSRTGDAILAASAADATAGTDYKAIGAGLDVYSATAGFLTMTTVAAVALTNGQVEVYAIISKAY
jgi:hypothetical protein